MDKSAAQTDSSNELPLLSNAFLLKVAIAVGILALLSVVINIAGRELGERLSRAGHSASTQQFTVTIGQDHLTLAANTLRFEEQRRNGKTDRADLYFLWPDMSGYSAANSRSFNDVSQSDKLIFVQVSQSTMSRDMSGRLEPIYAHLFEGEPEPANYGLTLHHLRAETGYGSEIMYTASSAGADDYAVRCLPPAANTTPSSGDCQRDIHVGRDLTVLYRFSSARLPEWHKLDNAIRSYFEARLQNGTAKASRLN